MTDPYYQALDIVGSNLRYQKLLLVLFTLIYIVITFMLLGSPFIIMNPIFVCDGEDGKVTQAIACDKLDKCQITNDYTLTAYLNLYCDRQIDRDVVQSFIYLGSVMGLFIMNMLADTKGRKFAFLLAFLISIVGYLVLILGAFIDWIPLMAFAQVLIGFGSYSALIIGYSLISDFCQDKIRQLGIIAMNGVWALAQASLAIFYYWYNYWLSFIIAAILIPAVMLAIVTFFLLVQSPRFLHSHKRMQECRNSFMHICKWNKRPIQSVDDAMQLVSGQYEQGTKQQFSDEQLQQKQRLKKLQASIWNVFCSKKQMKIILVIALVEITTNTLYYGMQFSLEQIGRDFGINILFSGLIEAAAYFSFNLFVTRLPRKKGLLFFNLTSVAIGAFFLFPFISGNKIAATVVLCLCRFANTYSQGIIPLLQGESFPAQLQSTGWGLIEGTSQMGSFCTPYIVSIVTNWGVNPILAIVAIMAIFGLFPIKFIKQTLPSRKPHIDSTENQSLLE